MRPAFTPDPLLRVWGVVRLAAAQMLKLDQTSGGAGMSEQHGDQGERGKTGDVGQRGQVGRQGEQGETGPAGEGERGKQGDRGLQGFTGLQGEEGKQGLVGVGVIGERGRTGDHGQDGAEGPAGPRGLASRAFTRGLLVLFLFSTVVFSFLAYRSDHAQQQITDNQGKIARFCAVVKASSASLHDVVEEKLKELQAQHPTDPAAIAVRDRQIKVRQDLLTKLQPISCPP